MHDFTINTPEEMKHLILIGTDGVMTDYLQPPEQVYGEYRAKKKGNRISATCSFREKQRDM